MLKWREAVAACQTYSRLHVLVGMFDSCIKWERSLATKVSIVKKCLSGSLLQLVMPGRSLRLPSLMDVECSIVCIFNVLQLSLYFSGNEELSIKYGVTAPGVTKPVLCRFRFNNLETNSGATQ